MRRIRTDHAGRPASPFSIAAIALIAILSIVLAACGSSAGAAPQAVGNERTNPPAEPAPGTGTDTGAVDPNAVGLVDDARIVRTGTMELEVTDVNLAVAAARDAIRGLGGYIGASSASNEDDQPRAQITYRIPVDRWEDALAVLRALNGLTKKVVVERTEAVEVTGQIIDLEARIRNLRASESALQAISAQAAKISDVLEVQAQLTSVRGEIEQLTAQLTEVSQRAAYATLTTTFATAIVAVEVAARNWDPATIVDEASASLVDLLQGLASAGIWFAIVWLPIIVTLTIVAMILSWLVRRSGIFRRSGPPAVPPWPPTASAGTPPAISSPPDATAAG